MKSSGNYEKLGIFDYGAGMNTSKEGDLSCTVGGQP